MDKRLLGTVFFVVGVVFTIFGAALTLLNGPVSADAPAQREQFTDTECLACHTDQARLQSITDEAGPAEPEESSLSSGPG